MFYYKPSVCDFISGFSDVRDKFINPYHFNYNIHSVNILLLFSDV